MLEKNCIKSYQFKFLGNLPTFDWLNMFYHLLSFKKYDRNGNEKIKIKILKYNYSVRRLNPIHPQKMSKLPKNSVYLDTQKELAAYSRNIYIYLLHNFVRVIWTSLSIFLITFRRCRYRLQPSVDL